MTDKVLSLSATLVLLPASVAVKVLNAAITIRCSSFVSPLRWCCFFWYSDADDELAKWRLGCIVVIYTVQRNPWVEAIQTSNAS